LMGWCTFVRGGVYPVIPRGVYELERGFTLAELLAVLAIIGLIALVSLPTLLSYGRAAAVKAGAEELVSALNRGRSLAITRNQNVCVEVANGNQYRYWLGTCLGGTVWNGLGAGSTGFFTVANDVTLATNANPVFNRLGAAPTVATLTVTDSGGLTRTVVVAASGRVTK
jgi:prepilin-type N-terminal cleavage/methylation domain-containing protein